MQEDMHCSAEDSRGSNFNKYFTSNDIMAKGGSPLLLKQQQIKNTA